MYVYIFTYMYMYVCVYIYIYIQHSATVNGEYHTTSQFTSL